MNRNKLLNDNKFVVGKLGKGTVFHFRQVDPKNSESFEDIAKSCGIDVRILDLSKSKHSSTLNPFAIPDEKKRDE
jgi:hypothetical protein